MFHANGRVLRAVTAQGIERFHAVRATGFFDRLIADGRLLPAEPADPGLAGRMDVLEILEHPPLPFISYPYEWPFLALQAAALLHLDIQIEALDAGVMLTDATAYNIQFIGTRPVFIDHLAFRPYRDGELWAGHRQFCAQFLHPLLLRSLLGLEYQAWYRGSLEGIPGDAIARLLRWRDVVNWQVLVHVVLPAKLQRNAASTDLDVRSRAGALSRPALREMLGSLRRWIARLQPRGLERTTWADYESVVTGAERSATMALVRELAARTRPALVWDLGCNVGTYAEAALGAGAEYVVGLDSDPGALHHAFARARDRCLALLPLSIDLANPSPGHGWRERERKGLAGRRQPDALLALSVIHHIAIERNVPLEDIVSLLAETAGEGLVGFVPNTDPRAQALFRGREEIFRSYTLDNFLSLLRSRARIIRQEPISGSDRVLVWFSTR